MRSVDVYTLRRRRFMGLMLLATFLLLGLAFNGWTVTPIWAVFDTGVFATKSGTFVAGSPYGDWIYAECDGERQQVTVSRNGGLAGVAGLESLRTVRFPNWCDLPTVDNPQLAAWQAQLGRLQELTRTPGASGTEVLSAARDLPVSYLYLKPLSDWIHADYANAVAFLDALAEEPMRFDHPNHSIVIARRQAFSRLINDALDIALAREVAPEKLGNWLSERQILAGGRALRKLARLSDRGAGGW